MKTEKVNYHHGKGFFAFKGIVVILLGLALWFNFLTLAQTFAISLVLLGIKKIYLSATHHC
ncbi:hypothetical protein K8R33_04685 [archaeon]|nr:hypothetical protein [archaeon]